MKYYNYSVNLVEILKEEGDQFVFIQYYPTGEEVRKVLNSYHVSKMLENNDWLVAEEC